MRLTHGIIGTTVIAAMLVGGVASQALAGDTEAEPLTATQPAASTESLYDITMRVALNDLAGTQTQDEILAIVNSPDPSEALYDPNTQTYLAARYVEPTMSPFAIGVRGPGCATGDACATNAVNNGYYGTGSKSINLSGVTKITSGNRVTTWWQSNHALMMQPNKTITFGAPYAHLTLISRD